MAGVNQPATWARLILGLDTLGLTLFGSLASPGVRCLAWTRGPHGLAAAPDHLAYNAQARARSSCSNAVARARCRADRCRTPSAARHPARSRAQGSAGDLRRLQILN